MDSNFWRGLVMRRFVGFLLVTGAVALMTSGTSDIVAQGKKAGKGTIELVESKDGKYRFTVRDADGKYLGGSTSPHATEKEAREAAEELKRVMATATYVSKKSEDKKKD